MHRRRFLVVTATALGTGGLAGCQGQRSPTGDGGTSTGSPSTSTGTQETPTSTPVPFPDDCRPLPDVDGLPERPAELTEASVRSYVTEFERVYVVATESEYGGIERIDVTHVETVGERFRVQLAVEGVPATSTPEPDGETPTGMPPDATAHRALYRLEGDRMVRELRGHASGGLLSSDCWVLPTAES